MIKKLIKFFLFILFIFSCTPLFCDSSSTNTTPEEYSKDEFPQHLQDLRRFEIITLGALPFVTLDTTLAYSGMKYVQHNFDSAYLPNIFATSSEGGFTTEEQFGVLLTALGISVGIGITDLTIRIIQRNIKRSKIKKTKNQDLTISEIENDPSATKIQLPADNDSEVYEISDDSENTIEIVSTKEVAE